MEREKIYLSAWRLNAVKIINALAELVINDAQSEIVNVWPFVKTRKYVVVDSAGIEKNYDFRSYLSFTSDGTYYYVQLGDNPFLDWFFVKERIVGGTVSAGADAAVLPYDWYIAENVYSELTDDDAYAHAVSLYSWLKNAKVTNERPKDVRRAIKAA